MKKIYLILKYVTEIKDIYLLKKKEKKMNGMKKLYKCVIY